MAKNWLLGREPDLPTTRSTNFFEVSYSTWLTFPWVILINKPISHVGRDRLFSFLLSKHGRHSSFPPYPIGQVPWKILLGTLTRRNVLIKLTESIKELVNKITLDLNICQANKPWSKRYWTLGKEDNAEGLCSIISVKLKIKLTPKPSSAA